MATHVGSKEENVENRDGILHWMNKRTKILLILLVIGIIFLFVILGIAAAAVAELNNRPKETTTTSTGTPPLGSEYAESIRISNVMRHLNELQRIASSNTGNRAVFTVGFNQTLDYIFNSLVLSTNFQVKTSYFPLRNFVLSGPPTLITSINDTIETPNFSTNLTASDFYFAQYTTSANFTTYVPISVIPNLGCNEADWFAANTPSLSNRVALVKAPPL